MKRVAGGMLVVATIVFVVAHILEKRNASWGYLRATAEAAMVGGLADWFAVTALFRHPLGIPIPHTAIIRKRKDDIGRGLGTFVSELFLTAESVSATVYEARPSERVGLWLAQRPNAEIAAVQFLSVAGNVVETVREEEVRTAIEQAVEKKVRATPAGPIAGRAIDLLIDDGRHQQALGVMLLKVADVLVDSKAAFRERLAAESPWWVPESVDDRVFARLFDAVMRFVFDVAQNPNHELRVMADRRIVELAHDLQSDPQMQARADQIKEELLDNPALRNWSQAVWGDLKERLKERTLAPDDELISHVADRIQQFGQRLLEDPELAETLDRRISSTVGSLAENARGEVGEFIASTVKQWDASDAVNRIELQVGRDLQFIRINGTLVGGLAGLAIYALTNLVF